MVPSAAQGTSEEDLPRNLFFGVEDRRLGGAASLTDKNLAVERVRRHQLAEHVKTALRMAERAISSLKDFDQTGNTDQAIDHVAARLDDVAKLGRNLINEVERSIDRFGDELDALHARDEAAALAAINAPAAAAPPTAAAGPNPAAAELTPQAPAAAGPTPADVAQVKANLNRALDRRQNLVWTT